MSKVDPRTEIIKIIILVIDPQHRDSNEAEKANEDIYDVLNWIKPLVSMVYTKIFQRCKGCCKHIY